METTTAKQIHQAVDTANTEILNPVPPHDFKRITELLALGFINSEHVRDFADHQEHHSSAAKFQAKYHCKFITDHQMRKIRARYDLQSGSFQDFLGDVPSKNLKDISSFKVRVSDLNPRSRAEEGLLAFIKEEIAKSGFRAEVSAFGRDRDTGKWEELDKELQKSFDEQIEAPGKEWVTLPELMRSSKYRSCVSITADKMLFKAPAMNLCPIVTVAVKGGYLIVTAWGDEAADRDIVNANNN